MPARLLCCFAILLALPVVVSAGESRNGISFPVQAAIMPEDGEPMTAAVLCKIGEDCEIFNRKRHDFHLSLKIQESSRCLVSELSLTCEAGDCSFNNGLSSRMIDDGGTFDFYAGRDGWELVLRKRQKIGSVLLIVPDFGPVCPALKNYIKM